MKKIIITLTIGLFFTLFNNLPINAQHVSVNINVDIQPAWGPSGYHYADFYYIPSLNIYYDVNNGLFIYPSGRRWVSNYYLPRKYRKYDLYLMYKVVLNDVYEPWMYNNYHRNHYVDYRNNHSQIAIYYINDNRYHRAKHNHWAWVEPRYMPKQKHKQYKHLTHNHRKANFDRNQYRSSANGSQKIPSRNNSQASNKRVSTQNGRATTNNTRADNRSSNLRNNTNRTKKTENSNAKRTEQTAANSRTTENRSSGSRNQVRSNSVENKKINKTENRNSSRSQGTSAPKRSENKSTVTRSSDKKTALDKRSNKSENNNRSTGRSNRSR